MEMNIPRLESHVAQKNRRHKLRLQQNSGDLNRQHQPQHHPQIGSKDIHRSFPYNRNVFPSEMLNSVHRNPHLLLPPGHCAVSHGQDSSFGNFPNPQDCNSWKTVFSSQQVDSDHWNVASYLSAALMNSGSYGYHQDVQHVPVYSSLPFSHDTLQGDHVTIPQPQQLKNDTGMTQSIPCWMNNSVQSELLANRVHDHREQMTPNEGNCNTQGLSLSLSSGSHDQTTLQSGLKPLKSDNLPNSDPKSVVGVTSFPHRSTGPLGPFTGYATILKNSKYLKPAQELLNNNCDVGCQEFVQTYDDVYSHKILEEEMSMASGGWDEHIIGRSKSGTESVQPEFNEKKARLLYIQEEVCRNYKQYLQQMQMVISSFETVTGLSAASPYFCLALKAVSRQFHFVKKIISERLLQMKEMVGDDIRSSTTSRKALDSNGRCSSRLKWIQQRLGKSGGGAAEFFSSQQPVWRPQRGLPERAISVLKTWLFDHFLHPYPSDADKHMLANQTGLTRNQVSNWFINARVRIWKPMVEEIHTLETKALAESNTASNPQPDGQDSRMDMSSIANMQPPECSRNPGTLTVEELNNQLQDHEKEGRPEYQIPLSSMDRLMSIMPYPQATFDPSGLGPVSLTLGLRQNAEHVQQLQQRFGGQLIHDIVG